MRLKTLLLSLSALLSPTPALFAQQAPAKPTPDVLIFTNGDQLTGKLQGAAGGNVTFASDMAGSLIIPFDKIKEVRSGSTPAEFALLKKGVPVNKKTPAPEGTATLADGNVIITPGAPAQNADSTSTAATVPAKDVDRLVAKAEFDHEVSGKHKFTEGWNGTATGGATIVRSTQTGSTFTAALNLVRSLPFVSWLAPRNRTSLNVVETYGKTTTPGAIPQPAPPAQQVPDVTTLISIFHADAERDQYFNSRLYALGDVAFDHNSSQNIALEQSYGGGLGWTPIKSPKQQFDLKADIHYAKQSYIAHPGVATTPSLNLVGATFFEGYTRNLPHKVLFTQTANIIPAFNNSNAYSANILASLSLPVFKRLSASFTTTDNYLNDPTPGYKKNSYQFVTGVSYSIH